MADKLKLALAALLVVAGIAGYYLLAAHSIVLRFLAVAETRKVVWPSRKETAQTTGMVLAFVLVMAIFLWIVDAVLVWGVKLLMGPGA